MTVGLTKLLISPLSHPAVENMYFCSDSDGVIVIILNLY